MQADWECQRDDVKVVHLDGQRVFRASGFARPIPGVDPRRNLHGVSFAVANLTGVLARAMSLQPAMPASEVLDRMERVGSMRAQLGHIEKRPAGQTHRPFS